MWFLWLDLTGTKTAFKCELTAVKLLYSKQQLLQLLKPDDYCSHHYHGPPNHVASMSRHAWLNREVSQHVHGRVPNTCGLKFLRSAHPLTPEILLEGLQLPLQPFYQPQNHPSNHKSIIATTNYTSYHETIVTTKLYQLPHNFMATTDMSSYHKTIRLPQICTNYHKTIWLPQICISYHKSDKTRTNPQEHPSYYKTISATTNPSQQPQNYPTSSSMYQLGM
jgi:hypothetical protein